MRSPDEYRETLFRHLRNLVHACERVDRGDVDAAPEIASRVAQLVLDRGRNFKAVLGQLGPTSLTLDLTIPFLSTARQYGPEAIAAAHLVRVNAMGGTSIPGGSVLWHGAQYTSPPDFRSHQQAPSVTFTRPTGSSPSPVPSWSTDPFFRMPHIPFRWTSFHRWWDEEPVILIPSRDGKASPTVFTRSKIVLTVRDKDEGAHTDPDLPADYLELSRGSGLGVLLKPAPIETLGLANVKQVFASVELFVYDADHPNSPKARSASQLVQLVRPSEVPPHIEIRPEDLRAVDDIVAATLRQIGHELILTLQRADQQVRDQIQYRFPSCQMPAVVGPTAKEFPEPPPRIFQRGKDWVNVFG